jgi:glycosyltransferase involved in cell wall biosynthesis
MAIKMRKPYLVEVVGCVLDSYWNYNLKGKLVAFPAYFLTRQAVKSATHVVYVTKEFLQSRYPNKNKTCAISDVALQPTDAQVLENRSNKINNMNRKLVLGTAGAVDVSYKGQEFVIRAIPEIEKRLGITVEYRLAGGGDTSRLTAIAKECGAENNLKFEGVVSHNLIFDWFDNLDIYIQSGTVEGLSRALLEAMSRGLPCVATKVGGNPELVDEKYLVSKSDAEKMPSIIADCIYNMYAVEEMKNQAKHNFNKANNEYNRAELDAKRVSFYTDFRDSMVKSFED